MTKELIVAAVLGTALTAGWFIPIGIEAAYTGDRVYQSEMISKNDVDIHSFSLLGRKKEIEVFDMRPASLNGEDLEFDISASNMTTTLVESSSFIRSLIRVVFPDPLFPTIKTNSPLSICKFAWFTAGSPGP